MELTNLDKFDLHLDYKVLCEDLCKGKHQEAYDHFILRTKKLVGFNNTIGYRLALNNLNYSIYHYLLFIYDISLTKCCYANILLMHNHLDKDTFMKISKSIIDSYYSEMIDMQIVSRNPLVQSVIDYIEENIGKQILIGDIADILHINSTYLSQTFKKHMGQSFTSYLAQHRIHHAKLLLLQTNKTMEVISSACGFGSASYFSTVFTSHTGMSPGIFRKNHALSGMVE